MKYELIEVNEPADWAAFHAIRRVELFEAKGRVGVYDENHPDDVAAFAHPVLLKFDGRPVGTARIDVMGDGRGVFRLVAIAGAEQGRGHGRVLAEMTEQRAREMGVAIFLVNSAPETVGFYEKTGWHMFEWDRAELVGFATTCVQMRKLL